MAHILASGGRVDAFSYTESSPFFRSDSLSNSILFEG
jgi:hypothetical protein